jgi:hypothetical protein
MPWFLSAVMVFHVVLRTVSPRRRPVRVMNRPARRIARKFPPAALCAILNS